MVKLKKVNEEQQLDLFSWKPKEINKHKENEYDGWSDIDERSWFNPQYMNRKFDDYNTRFFSGKITKIPVIIQNTSHALGSCASIGSKSLGIIKPSEIRISNRKFKNRYSMENILIHEMCHAYQIEILCDSRLIRYSIDCKGGEGSRGHGPLFFQAADLVNKSSNNVEGFKITQYNEDIDTAIKRTHSATGYVYIRPSLDKVKVYTIADTKNNQEIIRGSNKEYLFTYKNADSKGAITTIFGRSSQYFYPYSRIIKQVCEKIKSRDLIPIVQDRDLQQQYIAELNDGTICVTKFKPSDGKEIIMNDPYSVLLNRMEITTMLNTNSSDASVKRFNEAVSLGVYTLPNKENQVNEAMSHIDIEEAEDIIADAGNTLLMKDLGDDQEEIIIE